MRRISVSQVSSVGWSFEQDLAHYASVGVEAVALLRTKVADVGFDAAQRALEASGLRVSGFGTCGFFSLHEPECWSAEIDEASRLVAQAGALGASTVTLVTGSGRGRPYPESQAAFLGILERQSPFAFDDGRAKLISRTQVGKVRFRCSRHRTPTRTAEVQRLGQFPVLDQPSQSLDKFSEVEAQMKMGDAAIEHQRQRSHRAAQERPHDKAAFFKKIG